jgi:hypothetical protein
LSWLSLDYSTFEGILLLQRVHILHCFQHLLPTPSVNINALLAVALLPMINHMMQDPANFGNSPVHWVTTTVPAILPQLSQSMATVADIMDFLEAFKYATQFDIMNRAATLTDLDLTPSLIENETISSACLGEILGLHEGGVLAVQKFVKECVGCHNEKTPVY